MDYTRYLSAKKTVDDRALNERVLQDLDHFLRKHTTQRSSLHVLRVLEVGAGIGAMCTRLLRRGTFSGFKSVDYTLLDIKADVLQVARQRCMEFAQSKEPLIDTNDERDAVILPSASVKGTTSVHHQGIEKAEVGMKLPSVDVTDGFTVSFHIGDALQYMTNNEAAFDLVIAAAVLDIWPLRKAVSLMLSCLRKDGIRAFYFPINFDGTTDFYPPSCEGALFDAEVEKAFHEAMGTRCTFDHQTMAAHTGRHVLPVLSQSGASVLSMGSSAWIVTPTSAVTPNTTTNANAGLYNANEAYFLHCIVDFICDSICDSVPASVPSDEKTWHVAFHRYIASRRQQIENGELSYLAHNIDVFGCMS